MAKGIFQSYRDLTDAVDPAASARMLRGLDERLQKRRERRSARRWAAVGVMATAAAGVLVLGGMHVLESMRSQGGREQQPRAEAIALASVGEPQEIALPHGGKMRVEPGSTARLVSRGERGATLELLEGQVTLRVSSVPGARWIVRADGYTVEAVGTRFTVRRTGDKPDVTVHEGAVTLRGPDLPASGLRIEAPPEPAPARLAGPEVDTGKAEEAARPDASEARPGRPPRLHRRNEPRPWLSRFREAVRDGETRRAADLLPADFPSRRPGCSARDLLDAGDILAAAGRAKKAERCYVETCELEAGSAACATALVRLSISRAEAGDLDGAIHWSTRYLEAHPKGAFTRQVLGRRMRWLAEVGREEAARIDARRAIDQFPEASALRSRAEEILSR
jgi:hypothetical protein